MEEKVMETVTENVMEHTEDLMSNANGKVIAAVAGGGAAIAGLVYLGKKVHPIKWVKAKLHRGDESEEIAMGDGVISDEDADKLRKAVQDEENEK